MSIRQLSKASAHSRATIANTLKTVSLSVLSKPLHLDIFDDSAVQLLRRTPPEDARAALISFCKTVSENKLDNCSSFLVKEIASAQRQRFNKAVSRPKTNALRCAPAVRAHQLAATRRPVLAAAPTTRTFRGGAPSPIGSSRHASGKKAFFPETPSPRRQGQPLSLRKSSSPTHTASIHTESWGQAPRQQPSPPPGFPPSSPPGEHHGIQPVPQLQVPLRRPLVHSIAPFLRVTDDAQLERTLPRHSFFLPIASPCPPRSTLSPPSPMSQLLNQTSVVSLSAPVPAQSTTEGKDGWSCDWSIIAGPSSNTLLSSFEAGLRVLSSFDVAAPNPRPNHGRQRAVEAAWRSSSCTRPSRCC
jgi:hypothetical protein